MIKENNKPSAEDFTEKSIEKAVFSEALQHPSTLFSAAVSILSGLYMGIMNFSKPALAVTLGSGALSLMSFVYNYFFRSDKLAENYTKNLLKQRVTYKKTNAENVRKQCKKNDFDEGINAYDELNDAYKRLIDFLKNKSGAKKSFMINKFLMLADETFYGGISLINKGAELFGAIRDMHESKLERELRNWQRELRLNKRTNEKELELLKIKIDNHGKRLDLLKKRKSSLIEIMDQVEVLESTLDSTYLEVLDLLESDTIISGDKLVSNLQNAVKSARNVEDRIRGNKHLNEDIYLQRE